MNAVDFIDATDFVAVAALVIAFFTVDRSTFRTAMGLAALWLVVACVLAVVK